MSRRESGRIEQKGVQKNTIVKCLSLTRVSEWEGRENEVEAVFEEIKGKELPKLIKDINSQF